MDRATQSHLESLAKGLDISRAGQDWRVDETLLLLSLLDLALTNIEVSRATRARDPDASLNVLMKAVDTYSSVKNLLPKLDLAPDQIDFLQARLNEVRQRLWPGPADTGR
jgi:hypothetical protein